MRRIILLLALLAAPAFGQWQASGSFTVPAASVATKTNFTVPFGGSNTLLKTVGNSGLIQHTVTQVGQTVPADFALTTDPTCATITGYTWDVEFYDGTGGNIKGWVMIPSLTTGASVTVNVCVGNASVSTWQGGAQGAEFDSSTLRAFHFPNGTSLSLKDWSSNAGDISTNVSGAAAAGKIDGAVSLPGTSSYMVGPTASAATNMTVEQWVNSSTLSSQNGVLMEKEPVNTDWMCLVSGGSVILRGGGLGSDLPATAPSNSTWHHVVCVYAGTTGTIYVDGAQAATGAIMAIVNGSGSLLIGAYNEGSSAYNYTGSLDEMRLSATNRSADWIADEYTNQNSPPAIGTLTQKHTLAFSGCPTSGTKNVASSSCTVSIAGATFDGVNTVTIADNGNGALITPSVGGACNTPCAVTPTNGTSSFTFTFKAVVIGSFPITATNSATWINPSAVTDVVTFSGALHTAQATGNCNVTGTWDTGTIPGSGDTFKIPAGLTVHIPNGYTAIVGGCSATRTTADGEVDAGAALIVDGGAVFRMQGNIEMNGSAVETTNLPILQYTLGATVLPDECGTSTIYGPFATNNSSWNLLVSGIDAAMVNVASGANPTVTLGNSGQTFNTSTYPGSSWTINGTAYPIASCADTTHCTVTGTPGALTQVYALLPEPGALTTWPPTTSISAVNTENANPVLFNDNGKYDYMLLALYGVDVKGCGSASIGCLQPNMQNIGSNTTLLSRNDVENFIFDTTSGEYAQGSTSLTGTIYARVNGVFKNTIAGLQTVDPKMVSGASGSSGQLCAITDVSSDGQFGSFSDDFNLCGIGNIAAWADLADNDIITSTVRWTSMSNLIVARPDCTNSMNWQGSASNFLVACENNPSSNHVTIFSGTTQALTFTGGFFEGDASSLNECHFLEDSESNTNPAVLLTNNVTLPNATTGATCSLTAPQVAGTMAEQPQPVLTLQNNESIATGTGSAGYGFVAWTGHGGVWFPNNVWLAAMNANMVSQQTSAGATSYPLSTPFNSATGSSPDTAPADQVTVSGIDYNGLFNMATASLFTMGYNSHCSPSSSNGTHYQICTSTGTPGVHDITGDPHYGNTGASLLTWASTLGHSGTIAGAQAVFAGANPATYSALFASLWSYLRSGVTPQNPVFWRAWPKAGSTGIDVGLSVPMVQHIPPAGFSF